MTITYYSLADLPELADRPVKKASKRRSPTDREASRTRARRALTYAHAASLEARRVRREATIQEVAYLRGFLGMSYDRIAEELGVRRNSLAKSFARWRKLGYTDLKFPYYFEKRSR